jgi:hypothetical protein
LWEEDGFTVRRDAEGYIDIIGTKSKILFAKVPRLIAIYRKKAIHIFEVSWVLQSAHANHFLFKRREGPVPINPEKAKAYLHAAPHCIRVEKVHPPGEDHHLRLLFETDTAAAGSHAQEESVEIVDCPLGYNKLGDGLI